MSEIDDLLAQVAVQPAGAPGATDQREEGYNPATGRLQVTVRPRRDDSPPPDHNAYEAAPNRSAAPIDSRSRELLIRTVLGEAAV